MSVEYCNSVSAPASLDVKFFQEVLENALLDDGVTTKKISFEMGSGGGDNYCSQIYRVRVTFQCKSNEPLENISVIVKSIPVTDNTKFLEDLSVFLKEKIFYRNILPRMEILLDNVKFGPKLYHSHKEPINTLVFEDLNALGYNIADREMGLDHAHCKLVMKRLGQFHGVSMIMHQKDPFCMKSFQEGMLAEKSVNGSEIYDKFLGNNIQGLLRTISKWKGYESITEKVRKYAADLKQNLIKSQQPIAGELKVLNHGDLWVNNILFKYKTENNQQQVADVIFLDFQMSLFGSPGFDINYFLNTSLQLDVLKEKRYELIQTYHTAMCEILSINRSKTIPSLDDILTEVRRREWFGFFASFGPFPTMAMDKKQSGDNNFDNFMDADFAMKKAEIMFSSKRVQDTIRYTLKRFDELGVLD